ncbi:MAG: aconitate hydratase [Kiritimatiellae bacterium]|nr:aconitate hydratase [Kiritimatiellia bacterium]
MGLTVTEKILTAHLVSGELKPGREIAIRVDQTLTQDATGTLVYLEFERMGIPRIRNELAVSYVDHNTTQVGPENADDHAFLASAAARFGAVFSRPGNGICHQVHLERFAVPGKTLLGADSHTPTAGGVGMLAIGAGGIDVAVAMAGKPFYLACPRVIKIELKGRLRPWVTAKDVALKVLELFGTKGNVDHVFEYGGPGVRSLDVPERATIANMGAECGVTTSVFPSDELTRGFLEAQGRGAAWQEVVADNDATYERCVKINLTELEPLAAAPHSPGNVQTVRSLAGMKVDQVLIGSCTNSSYRDLKTVARIMEGRRIAPHVSFGVAVGSRQVLLMLAKEGLLEILIRAGARILESACGFCIGNSMAPATNAVSLRTSNRNFEGRCGTASARVYLVSPPVAALAAIHGRIIDPFVAPDAPWPRVQSVKSFDVDDSLLVFPPPAGQEVTIVRGPHIGSLPELDALPESLSGVATIKVGDKITTDHIMPAGPRLKYRSNIASYSMFVFEAVDPEFAKRAVAVRDKGQHNFVIAGESYGQGSSREQAALCPAVLGVRAVVAKSIERIHRANLVNFGIVPFVFERATDYDRIEQGDVLTVRDVRKALTVDGRAVLFNETRNLAIPVRAELSKRETTILLSGGLLNMKDKFSV